MTLKTKRVVIASLSAVFLVSLLFVQWMEILRRRQEAGLAPPEISVAAESRRCVQCHAEKSPGIVDHWKGSTHAAKGVACIECHRAEPGDPDAYDHEGALIAGLVTPRDCARCHEQEYQQFARSHHAAGGQILHSLDNFLAETVEGGRAAGGQQRLVAFDPYSPTPGIAVQQVNGLAAAQTGCQQCHGSKVALQGKDQAGNPILITVDELKPDEQGKPTNRAVLAQVVKNQSGKPLFQSGTWPNTGIGRINLDGSWGSCSACHSRHDFSPRRARQPESCGKCHLGPDHPQKEIYEESKHGIAYRDLKDKMHLGAKSWVLGEDYTAAPTCATCHFSANTKNGKQITHDAGQRISWTNRPAVSLVLDTDQHGKVIEEKDPAKRRALLEQAGATSAEVKRTRMKNVCTHCHTDDYVNAFYRQYDDFVVLYNEKFAKPGQAIMAKLQETGLTTPTPFDEQIDWTWFYLWHHEGRRARHGASMMAPDYAHWHGTYEVAERFYDQLIPQARRMAAEARNQGKTKEADAVLALIEQILNRPEHSWFERKKAGEKAE